MSELPTSETKEIKNLLSHSNAVIEYRSPRYMIVTGKGPEGQDQVAKIRVGITDSNIRLFMGTLPGELYATVSGAIEDALQFTDVKFSRYTYEQAKAIAAEGETDPEETI